MGLAERIAEHEAQTWRPGPLCTAGVALGKLGEDDRAAVLAAGGKIAARESVITWTELARMVVEESGSHVRADALSRHVRHVCACK